jgi:hypothetical protein
MLTLAPPNSSLLSTPSLISKVAEQVTALSAISDAIIKAISSNLAERRAYEAVRFNTLLLRNIGNLTVEASSSDFFDLLRKFVQAATIVSLTPPSSLNASTVPEVYFILENALPALSEAMVWSEVEQMAIVREGALRNEEIAAGLVNSRGGGVLLTLRRLRWSCWRLLWWRTS